MRPIGQDLTGLLLGDSNGKMPEKPGTRARCARPSAERRGIAWRERFVSDRQEVPEVNCKDLLRGDIAEIGTVMSEIRAEYGSLRAMEACISTMAPASILRPRR